MYKLIAVICILLCVGCANKPPYLSGVNEMTVKSESMVPAMSVGDEYKIDADARFEDISPGQIIAFWDGKQLVTHRVVGFAVKGDNNKRVDPFPVMKQHFRGRVILKSNKDDTTTE